MAEENVVEAVQEAPVDKELTFVLKISQTNTILAALDELPHKYSRSIIEELQKQAFIQLQDQSK